MTRYVAIHGHAYQPPRANPITGRVDVQPSAAPFHDWNERITSECYRPLGSARIDGVTDAADRELNLWNRVNFDLGPTLGVWFDESAPDVAELLVGGDAETHNGIAHPFVHAILPLSSPTDRELCIRWGLAEFETRFSRSTDGMWFPETALNTATLECARDCGVTWTLVAPHQVRLANGHPVDHRVVRTVLPSGRWFDLVPYDGGLSHGIAFGELLDDGVRLAQFLGDAGRADDLVVAATDMETFGHHHRFGEMALAKAIDELDHRRGVKLVTVDWYLRHVTRREKGVLVENTSWSCAHGVERWRSNCGCRFESGTDQSWRAPLRDCLNQFTELCAAVFDDRAGETFSDPCAARLALGPVVGASPATRDERWREFVERHVVGDHETARRWVNAELLRLEAWSSCAWFFDTTDRIEIQQVLNEALAAAAIYDELASTGLHEWLTAALDAANLRA